jgi:hypothetical protein
MGNDNLIAAYHAARDDYERAKSGSRPEMFIKFLVAERVLSVRSGEVDPMVERLRERYSP